MSRREIALLFDRLDLSCEACWACELVLTEPDASPNDYLNLAVLYFDISDYGTTKSKGIHPAFSAAASERSREVLDAAEVRFGPLSEARFWRRYFDVVQLDKECFERECAELFNRTESLTPAFYLFALHPEKYLEDATELAVQVRDGATAKDRYVRSVLEAEFAHRTARVRGGTD